MNTHHLQNHYKKEFSGAFKALRKRLGLTQLEIALRIGINPSAISPFEKGTRTPSLSNYLVLLEEFGLTNKEFWNY